MQTINGAVNFRRLTDVPIPDLLNHMNDPITRVHLPLLKGEWTEKEAEQFIALKEADWQRDGLGYWAIFLDDTYVGWGGVQLEKGEWDLGLVLTPQAFGSGLKIVRKILDFARADERIQEVMMLLPPSRTRLNALERLGAKFDREIEFDGQVFLKFVLPTLRS